MKLLNKYKEFLENGKDEKASFLNIFKEIQKMYSFNGLLSEEHALEILEFGDFFLENENKYTSFKNDKFLNMFKKMYSELKVAFRRDKSFIQECEDILYNLEVAQVRELESFYKKIDEYDLDKDIKISYKDGIVYTFQMPLNNKNNMDKILELKSYIARCLVMGGVIIVDFIKYEGDLKGIVSSGFVCENQEWNPLKYGFVRSIHLRMDCDYQEFYSFFK